jgi:cold shock CspA family protein
MDTLYSSTRSEKLLDRRVTSTVKRWLPGQGYGFIMYTGGPNDIFVHHSEIENADRLKRGQRVEFDAYQTDDGLQARNVTSLS